MDVLGFSRETEMYIYERESYFKKFMKLGRCKSKICKVGWQARHSSVVV